MITKLNDYRGIVSDEILSKIYKKATKLCKKHIVNVNSTYQGGGVAEILHNLVVLMNDIGVDMGWRILPGTSGFFTTTKRLHNALQGEKVDMADIHDEYYMVNNEKFSRFTHFRHDIVVIHDPQPLPLIHFVEKRQPWIWRCHIDLSNPNKEVWEYLKGSILRYDIVIVSDEKYLRSDLPVEQKIIRPSIDPLSEKNMDIPQKVIDEYIEHYNIPMDKPLITQISRFDKWKDPKGVIEVFKKVKQNTDCRLVLCGNAAADDPEGIEIYTSVVQEYQEDIEKHDIILITAEDNLMVNVLQRISDVILQKSLKEGFGLTVTEALWKGTPVIAGNVGGIPCQIIDGETGFLVDPANYGEVAERVIELLSDKTKVETMGKQAKEFVRENFLITRHLLDYLNLFIEMSE